MGNVCAASTVEEDANKTIESTNRKDAKDDSRLMKILLLGAGESGKSTIFKQMRIIHKDGYTDDERKAFVSTVHHNCLQNMKDLINAANKFGNQFDASEKADAQVILDCSNQQLITVELVPVLKNLWKSQPIQKTYEIRSQFQLADSAEYYFRDVERIGEPGYMPNDQDILRTRVRTSGIVEMAFEVDGVLFKMFDVGGQRNERRKWIHCFDNVQAVLFVAAMSEYDQVLYEDESQNRMKEALNLFGEICNSRYFETTSMILFLNKRDLFEQKIKVVDMKVCFPDYEGGLDYENGVKFLIQQFHALNQYLAKQIYVHTTCATDTDNIRFVFVAVKDIILTQNLKGSGFI
eukprot:c20383_g1_i1.p1 GENE.c20383_g1_i1~~c20383_g1_i1.p1  ORF type:complete len:349 (-),score=63.55 c20383_g1_i1:302-1348(-)